MKASGSSMATRMTGVIVMRPNVHELATTIDTYSRKYEAFPSCAWIQAQNLYPKIRNLLTNISPRLLLECLLIRCVIEDIRPNKSIVTRSRRKQARHARIPNLQG